MLILGLGKGKNAEREGGLLDTFSVLGSIFGIFFHSLYGGLGARGEGCSLSVYSHQISKLQLIVS